MLKEMKEFYEKSQHTSESHGMLISGKTGVGKTTLVYEFLGNLSSARSETNTEESI